MNADDQARGDQAGVPAPRDASEAPVGEFRPPETSNRQLFGLPLVISAVVLTFLVAVGAIVGTVIVAARNAVVAAREAEAQQLQEQRERERIRTLAQLELETKRIQSQRQAEEAESERRVAAARLLSEQQAAAQARALAAQAEAEAARRKVAEEQAVLLREVEERREHGRVSMEPLLFYRRDSEKAGKTATQKLQRTIDGSLDCGGTALIIQWSLLTVADCGLLVAVLSCRASVFRSCTPKP